jgi:hypothetical protein
VKYDAKTSERRMKASRNSAAARTMAQGMKDAGQDFDPPQRPLTDIADGTVAAPKKKAEELRNELAARARARREQRQKRRQSWTPPPSLRDRQPSRTPPPVMLRKAWNTPVLPAKPPGRAGKDMWVREHEVNEILRGNIPGKSRKKAAARSTSPPARPRPAWCPAQGLHGWNPTSGIAAPGDDAYLGHHRGRSPTGLGWRKRDKGRGKTKSRSGSRSRSSSPPRSPSSQGSPRPGTRSPIPKQTSPTEGLIGNKGNKKEVERIVDHLYEHKKYARAPTIDRTTGLNTWEKELRGEGPNSLKRL